MKLTHKDYLNLALPFIVATVTQPLLGAVDTAVIGQLGVAALIGGVAIGTVVMNTLYWLFGFFRVSTTGQSAMAVGRGDYAEQAAALIRPLVVAIAVGGLFILLRQPIWQGALLVIEPDANVAANAHIYFDIMIFGAPFVLANYTVIGWLMGQGKAKQTLLIQVFGNLLNIALNLLFVIAFDLGIAGVAYASFSAQFVMLMVGVLVSANCTSFSLFDYLRFARITLADVKLIASSNVDLLLRTVCILIFFNLMARTGAQLGTEILATNAILMQVIFIVSYLFDGIANASSVFAGKAVGAKDSRLLQQVLRLNTQWTLMAMLVLTTALALSKDQLVLLFTPLPELIVLYQQMSGWLVLFPLVAGAGLTLYGIFTGTGTTRPVFRSSAAALLLFLVAEPMLVEQWSNHGLWCAVSLFYAGRFVFLYPYIGEIKRKCIGDRSVKQQAASSLKV
ncbi:MATE family efflux transporter [Ferrimonas lipolytica]|uniref:MATE family efflux transporter n=1 Tax=Ferrimonas lipolytica TaxID=2724191 RepID=A0A6H1UEU9_9GAMM|nr:MATE family efflux transporter [Ferrimonas lipolytica]QIZ76322.1 MATE family efflux transporter [Ferrimonas lipolytica]